jgi:diguanylate cyclase (GGDEF)-like protein/PAS domain S-box-containing protein
MEGRFAPPQLRGELPYRSLLESSRTVLAAIINLDGQIVYANPACGAVLGYDREELLGRPAGELIPHALVADAIHAFESVRQGEARIERLTLVRRSDGTHIQLCFDLAPVLGDRGEVEWVSLTAHAMGDQPRRGGDQATGEARLIERLPGAVYVAEPGEHGRWLYVSPQIEPLLGYSREEWQARPELWAARLHPDDRDRVLEEEEHDAVRGSPIATEYRMVRRDGTVIWVADSAVMRGAPNEPRIYDGLLVDITERKQSGAALEFLAEHDALTGLVNRRRFMAELDTELRRKRRYNQPASVLMMDLDDLKTVNDSLGHQAGDELIRAVADVLEGRLRESDTVARLGGDEFAALLRGADLTEATTVAEQLVEAIRARVRFLAVGISTPGISIGVAELQRRFENAEDVLAQADRAMYQAKRRGGGAVEKTVA